MRGTLRTFVLAGGFAVGLCVGFRATLPLLPAAQTPPATDSAADASDRPPADVPGDALDEAAVSAAIDAVQRRADREAIAALIALDEQIAERCGDRIPGAQVRMMQTRILQTLAMSRDGRALDYVRAVFEAKTERRDEAAHALSLYCLTRPRNPQDWRYLVRSLPVVEGEQARAVLQALAKFRIRATRAKWLRQVILVGLTLDAAGQAQAAALLSRWAGDPPAGTDTSPVTLADWQQWFRRTYPQQPPPELPVDPPEARWKSADLRRRLAVAVSTPERLEHGKAVYRKATCDRCHRKDGIGERWGPDLSSLGWRLQKKEQLQATLFPSHRLNEEYPAFSVITTEGRVLNGMMIAAGDGRVRVVTPDGRSTLLSRDDIEEAVESNRSSMPDGLLEPLEYDEIRDLFLFLDHLGAEAGTPPR